MQGVPWMPTARNVEYHVLKLDTTPLAQAGPIAKQALKAIGEMKAIGSMPEDQARRLTLLAKQKLAEVTLWEKQKQDGLEQLTLSTLPSTLPGSETSDPTSLTE